MKKHILIIDDASTVRMYYASTLVPLGYEIDEALNGVEALEKLHSSEHTYDLLIVDVNMPFMDGYSFLEKYRELDFKPSPVVMISTEAKEKDAEKAYKAGANYYMVKPVTPDQLTAVVKFLVPQEDA